MSLAVIFPLVAPPFAGKGSGRLFARIDSREVFLRAVEIYAQRDQITQRIVMATPEDLQDMQERFSAHLGFQGVTVGGGEGGASDWFGCVQLALKRLEPEISAVYIHDPCCAATPYTLLDEMEVALEKHKDAAAIVPVLPSRAAYADVEGDLVHEYVDMSKVSEVQSPQLFHRKALEDAYARRGKDPCMDDAELVLNAGHKIVTVPGSRFNQRIDNDDMVRLCKDLIEHLPKRKPKTPLNPFGEAEW
jgi:2-C-methyl-D-erythritol 4-phosphate cytidylyltransferase